MFSFVPNCLRTFVAIDLIRIIEHDNIQSVLYCLLTLVFDKTPIITAADFFGANTIFGVMAAVLTASFCNCVCMLPND